MKTTRLFRSTILFAAIFLATSGLIFAGDPVPGLDISLEQIPGGIIKSVKTDYQGNFKFENLKPGKYLLHLGKNSRAPRAERLGKSDDPLPTAESHNSTRSNVKLGIAANGKTEASVSIELFKTGKEKSDGPIEVIIGRKGGSISGRIVLAAVKEKEVK